MLGQWRCSVRVDKVVDPTFPMIAKVIDSSFPMVSADDSVVLKQDPLSDLIEAIVDAFISGFVSGGLNESDIPAFAAQAASRRAGTLVSSIDLVTEQMINSAVTQAIQGSWTVDQLTDHLTSQAFSRQRALLIARTETVIAYNLGEVDRLKVIGFGFARVIDGAGCLPRGHDNNAPKASGRVGEIEFDRQANGQIWALDSISDNDILIGHPNCRRSLVPKEVN